jgi:hypothetical protein
MITTGPIGVAILSFSGVVTKAGCGGIPVGPEPTAPSVSCFMGAVRCEITGARNKSRTQAQTNERECVCDAVT